MKVRKYADRYYYVMSAMSQQLAGVFLGPPSLAALSARNPYLLTSVTTPAARLLRMT